jgi:hypothetical protein
MALESGSQENRELVASPLNDSLPETPQELEIEPEEDPQLPVIPE